jgi:hypothetical protein
MSVEKTIEKLLHGESDANIRFEELAICSARRISDVHSGSHHIFTWRRAGAHQPPARRAPRPGISSSTSPQDWQTQTVMKLNHEMTSAERGRRSLCGGRRNCLPRRNGDAAGGNQNAEDAIVLDQDREGRRMEIPEPRGRLVFA